MRSALLAVLVLAGCATPAGAPVERCGAEWRGVEPVIVTRDPVAEAEPVSIACMRQVDERRIRIGFTMPGGPSCYRLTEYEIVEGADAVSISLFVGVADDPTAGACAPDERTVTTEMDLQAPVEDRELLDGNAEG